MVRRTVVSLLLPLFIAAGCSGGPDQASFGSSGMAADGAEGLLGAVVAAMGAEGIDSILYSGRAWQIRNGWMQTPHADPPWDFRDEISSYRRTIDFNQVASLAQGDTFSSNLFLDPPVEGAYTHSVPAGDRSWSNQLEVWLTPWGFIHGASLNGVAESTGRYDGVEYRTLTWESPDDQRSPAGMRYTVRAYINDEYLIAAVETWVEDAFMGDFHIRQVYRDYRELDGIQVPQSIEQQRGGGTVFSVVVVGAQANPTNLTELMAAPQVASRGGGAGGSSQAATVEQIGERVWLVTGGYVALVAEFEDHALVFEAGQSEQRGEDILAAVTGLLPDKPVRYLINSHAHSDHTAGIVPFIRNGTTLITHVNNRDFLDMALSTPRTLLGEEQLNPQIQGVDGITVFQDTMNRVELHSVPNGHTDGMLVAVLPRQGIMFQADFTLPQQGAEPNPFVVTLAQYVAEVNPRFDRYLAVHAAQVPQTKRDLLSTIGL